MSVIDSIPDMLWCYTLSYIHPILVVSMRTSLPGRLPNDFYATSPNSQFMYSFGSQYTVEPSERARQLKRLAMDVFVPGIGISPHVAKAI